MHIVSKPLHETKKKMQIPDIYLCKCKYHNSAVTIIS